MVSNKIQTQLQTVKETMMKMAGDDTSLRKKLEILFKEQVITIATIITAVGMLISTIVLAVTSGSGAAGAAAGAAGGGNKRFVEKQLESFGNIFKYLAGKTCAALPGIHGTDVSFIFRVAAKVVEFVAQHLYLGIARGVALAVEYVGKKKRS